MKNLAEEIARKEEEELQRQQSIERVSGILDSHNLTNIDKHLAMSELVTSIRRSPVRRTDGGIRK